MGEQSTRSLRWVFLWRTVAFPYSSRWSMWTPTHFFNRNFKSEDIVADINDVTLQEYHRLMPLFLIVLVSLRVVKIIHRMLNEREQKSDVGLVSYGISKLLYTTGWILTAISEVCENARIAKFAMRPVWLASEVCDWFDICSISDHCLSTCRSQCTASVSWWPSYCPHTQFPEKTILSWTETGLREFPWSLVLSGVFPSFKRSSLSAASQCSVWWRCLPWIIHVEPQIIFKYKRQLVSPRFCLTLTCWSNHLQVWQLCTCIWEWQ